MLTFNKLQESTFEILMANKWTKFELITNLTYGKENYWLVKRENVDEELRLTEQKANELFKENKLRYV